MQVLIFFALAGASFAWDTRCSMIFESGQCQMCIRSYGSESRFRCLVPEVEIPNCLTYLSETECANCEVGYELTENACVKLTEIKDDCLWPTNGSCSLCKQGLLLKSGKCVKNTYAMRNCLYYSILYAGVICSRCARDYVSDYSSGKNVCVKAQGNLLNCISTFDGKECSQCQLNYFKNEEGCTLSDAYHIENADWIYQPHKKEASFLDEL